jgi:hypothetical protein
VDQFLQIAEVTSDSLIRFPGKSVRAKSKLQCMAVQSVFRRRAVIAARFRMHLGGRSL